MQRNGPGQRAVSKGMLTPSVWMDLERELGCVLARWRQQIGQEAQGGRRSAGRQAAGDRGVGWGDCMDERVARMSRSAPPAFRYHLLFWGGAGL